MKNVACSRLVTMLHLEIQKGKEAMKTPEFKKYLRGTAVCMRRLAMDTKGCGQLTLNYTYFANICISSVKTAGKAMATGVNYCGPEKTSHKGFCLYTLEKLTKDFPVGSYIFMEGTARVPGEIPLLSIG